MTMANVIDISEYQDPAKFDYQAAKSNGIKAVIIRLSVGNRRDNHAAEHIANCKKYGLKWHGYHYWYNLSGEAAFAISDAQSLGLTSSQYFFLDMEDKTLSSDWSAQFESFRSAVGGKYKVGLYCSDSPYKSHFDNAKMVAEGVYRWIAAYSYEPANYDTWQMSGEGSGGFGSYTGDVDRDYDKTGNLFKEETQPITPSTTPLYRQIIGEAGYDTDSGIYGLGRSYDNGKTFHVMDTVYGRIYRQQDGDSIWPFVVDKVKTVLDWSNITNKPDVALKSDVAAVSAVASSANAKADSNAKLIAGKASQEDLNNVSSTASSALDKATSNANALTNKVNKSDLVWTNITNRPDFDKVASQASQAVVTANTAESQASAAGQAAASASAQASAAKTTADTAMATANAAKASASTASATAASAQQIANSASASASATAVALKSKADTATVNAQFTAVNSNVASAQATADSAVAGLAGKLDKTALTWGNVAGKPTNLATTESVAKAQSAADSAVGVANGAVATANSAKSMATSAAGVANTANATANSALTKANSASTVASQASQSASNAVSVANQAKNTANTAIKASETLKDLGDYTATASGTTSNSTYSGLPRTSGVSMSRVYNNGYPTPYGNVLNVAGIGAGQLLLGWSGTSSANEHLYYRSHRDNGSGGWSTWDKIAYVSDLTWSNISGKPDVATKADVSSALTVANTAKSTADSALNKANSNASALNNKVNKSDLTWANISGKPSIPNADDTTTVSSGDLNNYTTTGKYYMPNGLSHYTNYPTTGTDMGDWFVMKVDAYHSGDMIVQTIYQINSGDVWVRQRWANAWKTWRQVTFWPS